jgi:integrase
VQRVEKPVKKQTFGSYLQEYIESLQAEKRFGNAVTFKGLKSSVLKYRKSLDFYFTDIDAQWLRGYEMSLRTNGNKENTIGIRFRALRVLFNRAITDKVVKRDYYPFDDFKVSSFQEKTIKRAITKEDIKRIISLDLKTVTTYNSPYLDLGRDLFLFSYLSCGINLTDMAKLQYANIIEGRVTYNRQKTGKLISFQLQPMAIEIIEKYQPENCVKADYIFPILDRRFHKTEIQKRDRILKATKATNKALKKIGEKLGLPIDLTTYVARHTYATVLKRSGVGTAIISESLGHSSEKITQIYLDSFENTQIDEAMKNLL